MGARTPRRWLGRRRAHPSIARARVGVEYATKSQSEVAQEALTRGQSVYDPVPAKGLLSKETLDNILRLEMLTKPRAMATKQENNVPRSDQF